MKEFITGPNEAGQRFDKYLKKLLKNAPDSFLYKMLRKKNITLNGKKASGNEKLTEGDTVKIFFSDETFLKMSGGEESERAADEGWTFRVEDVVYEDSDLLFVNKPAGILSQPSGDNAPDLAGGLVRYLLKKKKLTGKELASFRPAPMNRLDRNTTGIVLCGISLPGEQFLAEAIKERRIRKEYLVLVRGAFHDEGIRDAWLKKDGNRNLVQVRRDAAPGFLPIRTGFTVLAGNDLCTLLRADLITGRPHQIRAHLAYLGYPVAGDTKYGDPAFNRMMAERTGLKSQFLHAERVTFENADERFKYLGGRSFTAPLPETFKNVLRVVGLEKEGKRRTV